MMRAVSHDHYALSIRNAKPTVHNISSNMRHNSRVRYNLLNSIHYSNFNLKLVLRYLLYEVFYIVFNGN